MFKYRDVRITIKLANTILYETVSMIDMKQPNLIIIFKQRQSRFKFNIYVLVTDDRKILIRYLLQI